MSEYTGDSNYSFTDAVCSHQAVPTLYIRLTPEVATANDALRIHC
ncbi:10041_t:CDS:1, partial [Cetraspora pellucida]